MKVFLSWAGVRSRKIAEILQEELTQIFNSRIFFWISSNDISIGGVFDAEIFTALQESDVSIVCLLSSNRTKPWIYFEAGAVFGRQYDPVHNKDAIIPMIFDKTKTDQFTDTPFKQLQLIRFSRAKMLKTLNTLNRKYKEKNGEFAIDQSVLERNFEEYWPRISDRINNIVVQDIGGENMLTEDNVTELLSQYSGFSSPEFGSVIRYSSGFETSEFYKFLLENTSRRLYIFGRKNSKLSDRSFDEQIESHLSDHQFDLKVLFLNPESKLAADGISQDTRGFKGQLISSINKWITRFDVLGYNIADYCRMYDEKRDFEAIIADNIVLYKDVTISADGKPVHFTSGPFYITSLNSDIGSEQYNIFNRIWKKYQNNPLRFFG